MALDECEDVHARLGPRRPRAAVEQLAPEGGEEALVHGIVGAVAVRAHRRPPAHLQGTPKAMDVYCVPWSEWWMTSSGLRCRSAIPNISSTRSVCRCVAMDQPTVRRLHASRTTAR